MRCVAACAARSIAVKPHDLPPEPCRERLPPGCSLFAQVLYKRNGRPKPPVIVSTQRNLLLCTLIRGTFLSGPLHSDRIAKLERDYRLSGDLKIFVASESGACGACARAHQASNQS